MNKHIVLCMTFTAAAAFAQLPPTAPKATPLPLPQPTGTFKAGSAIVLGSDDPCKKGDCRTQSHSSEPIVIGDGSVKLSFYGVVSKDPDGRTLIAEAGKTTHSGTYVVATGVNLNGQVKTATGVQPATQVLSYLYEVEAWNPQQHMWVHQAFIDFKAAKDASQNPIWRIAPYPPTALDLVQDGPVVPDPPGYPLHKLTKYEYRKGELRLRIAWAWVNGANGIATRLPLTTGCSAYRIEPADHMGHTLPAPDHPCPTKRAITGKNYANFTVGPGLKAIDVSIDLK